MRIYESSRKCERCGCALMFLSVNMSYFCPNANCGKEPAMTPPAAESVRDEQHARLAATILALDIERAGANEAIAQLRAALTAKDEALAAHEIVLDGVVRERDNMQADVSLWQAEADAAKASRDAACEERDEYERQANAAEAQVARLTETQAKFDAFVATVDIARIKLTEGS